MGVLFIDFRKAFDIVNHTILAKLKATGISGDLLSWLTDDMSQGKSQEISQNPKESGLGTSRFNIKAQIILHFCK